MNDAESAMDSSGYDIIGDIHGYAARLQSLLKLMGYSERDGAWRHPERQAVFVGDLIDRGSQQLETVRLVRAMVEAGSAQIVLGNHEFNAVAYATADPSGSDYCRPHNSKNNGQHESFLAEFEFGSPIHRSVIDWFMEIPLWLDLGGVRVVHACWSDPHMAFLRDQLTADNALTEQLVVEGTTKGTESYKTIEVVLKGPEVSMGGAYYHDKEGTPRYKARLRWWDGAAQTLHAGAFVPAETEFFAADGSQLDGLPDTPLRGHVVEPYDGAAPVLFGHYWWRKESAGAINTKAACVDFSVANNGVLAAYRWTAGETCLEQDNFVDC